MTKEALKLALEALEVANSCVDGYYIPKGRTQLPEIELAITAIKEALAQPEQEPVAWMCADESLINKGYARFSHVCMGDWKIPVYTTPPQRTWVGLTDEEILSIFADCAATHQHMDIHFARAIEAKLKEKNI